jgi:hypothetical protein|tara:strand:+ start:1045 stop:1764 length:720 start_codon:yes stop_codon:yes gene_type:complete
MPLPKIATPTYQMVLPSTKKTINYRPFLVKEEKLLVLALESEDQKQITTAIKSVIKNCISSRGLKVENLPTFDIEYLFLNIRGKSVGEEVEVLITAPDDGETQIPVKIALDEIQVIEPEGHNNTIQLDDSLRMDMKYPSLEQFISNNFGIGDDMNLEKSFEVIASCIDKIYNEEEVWDSSDVSKKELMEFLEGMNSAQFKDIEKFFETMPKLSHTIEVTNPKTGEKSDVTLEGLSSFFA